MPDSETPSKVIDLMAVLKESLAKHAAERPTPASEPQPKIEETRETALRSSANSFGKSQSTVADHSRAEQREEVLTSTTSPALDDTDARLAAPAEQSGGAHGVDSTRYKPRPGPPVVLVELEYWRELTTEVEGLRASLDAREAEIARLKAPNWPTGHSSISSRAAASPPEKTNDD